MDELLSLFNMDIDNDYNLIADEKIDRNEKLKPIIKETNSIYSDTSKLEKFNDIEIYKNKNTNKIVIVEKITKIKDGDTIVISNLFSVRMLGIDAPESKQICKNIKEKPYKCGEKAAEYLKKLVGNSIVTCVNNGNEKYGRFLFVCKNNKHEDINREMVRNGWAVAYYSNLYEEEEQYARKNKLGIWSGSFQVPSEWRKQNKRK